MSVSCVIFSKRIRMSLINIFRFNTIQAGKREESVGTYPYQLPRPMIKGILHVNGIR